MCVFATDLPFPFGFLISLPTEILGLFAESLYAGDGVEPRFPDTVETDRGLVFGDGSPCSSDSDLGDLLEDEPAEVDWLCLRFQMVCYLSKESYLYIVHCLRLKFKKPLYVSKFHVPRSHSEMHLWKCIASYMAAQAVNGFVFLEKVYFAFLYISLFFYKRATAFFTSHMMRAFHRRCMPSSCSSDDDALTSAKPAKRARQAFHWCWDRAPPLIYDWCFTWVWPNHQGSQKQKTSKFHGKNQLGNVSFNLEAEIL